LNSRWRGRDLEHDSKKRETCLRGGGKRNYQADAHEKAMTGRWRRIQDAAVRGEDVNGCFRGGKRKRGVVPGQATWKRTGCFAAKSTGGSCKKKGIGDGLFKGGGGSQDFPCYRGVTVVLSGQASLRRWQFIGGRPRGSEYRRGG